MATDSPDLYSKSAISLVGMDMTREAGQRAMAEAKITPADVKVCEMHDCFSANEMITIDGLGLSEPGKAHELIRAGGITYGPGQKVVVNPSGGLISKGHPLGATGLAQCAELCWQLRGWANNGRLVDDASCALQHNLGLGGAAVVTVYKRADGKNSKAVEDVAKVAKAGYNPAVEARYPSEEEVKKVLSKTKTSDYLKVEKKREQARL